MRLQEVSSRWMDLGQGYVLLSFVKNGVGVLTMMLFLEGLMDRSQ